MFSRPYSVNKLRRNQSYRRALLEQLEDRRLLAANIAPVNSVPAEVQTTQVNTPIAFTDFRDNRISTSDADSGAHRVRTTLTAAHGVITLIYPDPTGGLTYSVGDGTNDPTMIFTGKVNDINQALRWIAFQPEADYVGSEATLTITTNDHGHFGTGGAKSDTDTVAITVTAVPDFDASPTWTTFPGALDTSFDIDGMQVLSVSAGIDFINDMTLLDDGKILAVGSVNNHYGLMRFNSDLTLDTTFGTNGVTETNLGTNRHINTMIFDKQGRIIVGGGTYLARYSVDGVLDTSFGSDALGNATGLIRNIHVMQINDLAIQPDGKLLAMGRDNADFRITRYLQDGTVDPVFGNRNYNVGGRHANDFGRGLTVRDDGDILLIGRGAQSTAFSLQRINTYGGKELQTRVDLPGDNEFVNDILELPDGKILVIGSTGSSGGKDFAVTRHHFDGTLDTTFATVGKLRIPVLNSADQGYRATLQPDGKILISGSSYNGSNWDLSIARISYDGVLDATFAGDGTRGIPDFTGANDYGHAVLSMPDGKILIAGRSGNKISLIRLLGDFNMNSTEAPTLNEINDLNVLEDAPQQTVNLAGITDGDDGEQPLQVTAASNNTLLLANPAVVYTSPNATGTLSFTPLADKFGVTTITVTVTDGGADKNLATTGDNLTTSRTFDVTVNPVNDEPTLIQPDDLTIDEDAPRQTVNLNGITAGGGETQNLAVTAVSSNTSLIADPTVVYSSANATGRLKFTPLADQNGTATITVTVIDGGLDNDLATTVDNLTTSHTFDVTVNPVNDDPTLIQPDNLTIDEDASEQTVNLTGITAGGGETQNLAVTAVSNNTSLIANPTVVYSSAAATGSLKFAPLADQSGTATITVTVTDGGLDNDLATTGDNATTSRTFDVTVNPVNDDPTLIQPDNLTIDEDASEQTVNLTGITAGGGETQNLAVTAVSDNTSLIANPTVAYTSANATGTVSFTPLADKFGVSTITVTVTDGGLDNDLATTVDNLTTSRTFDVTVNPVNDDPTLNSLVDLTIEENSSQKTVNLTGVTAGGSETQNLAVTAVSSNTSLIANPTVVYSSAAATGSLKFTPLADQEGTTTITVTVTDGGLDNDLATTGDNATTTQTFDVSVDSTNDDPTLDALSDVTIDEDASEQTVNLTGITAGGGETQNLAVTAVSSNTSLIANPTVVYSSAAATGSLKFTPLADQSGTTIITVTVTDGGFDNDLATPGDNATTSRTFDVTVNLVNDDPTLIQPDNLTIDEDASEQSVNLTGITAGGGETQNLAVTAVSSNTSLIANPTVVYSSAAATGSLKFTPLADQFGTTTITVTVEDGGLDNDLATTGDNATTSESFDVVVAATYPWHNKLNPLDINDDGAISSIDIIVAINELNSNGSYPLPKPRSATGAPYYDVNRDGQLTPGDPLQIINHLNETDEQVVFSFDITDVNNEILSQIEVGEHFFVSMYTQDTRSTAYGVFAAYLDMYYDARLVTPVGAPVNTTPFTNGASASFATAGVVDEWGVFADVNQTGSERLLVSTIQFKALAAGTNLFGSDSADIIPLHDVLLHGTNTPVPPSLIQFGSTSIAIVEADNGDGEGEGEGEDFFTRDGLQLLSNDNYLTDELEDTLDLLLGTTNTN